MNGSDRVVLVEMGFGIWEGGRHRGSARWSDVARVRILHFGGRASGRMRLELRLRDGSDVIVHPSLPGFEEFVVAAEQRLHGMRPLTSWLPDVATSATASDEVVLFERTR